MSDGTWDAYEERDRAAAKAALQAKEDFETLVDLTRLIKTPQIRDFVSQYLTKNTPEYFKHIAASSSGKYHPAYTLGDGGLVRHEIAAVKILYFMLQVDFWSTKAAEENGIALSQEDKDRMLAATFLHDTRKYGCADEMDKDDYRDHEGKAAAAVNEMLGVANSRVGEMIHAHMGQWGTRKPQNLQEILVHLADYLASRKAITLDTSNTPIER